MILLASAEAESYTRHLPDFVCDQVTERYVSGSQRPRRKQQDRLQAEVLYFKGHELYRDLRINGKRPADGREEPGRGVWSKGEYGTVCVFQLAVERRREEHQSRLHRHSPGRSGNGEDAFRRAHCARSPG